MSKSSDWSYENEYRILARDKQADSEHPKFLKITDNDFLLLPFNALMAIIGGCKADLDSMRLPDVKIKRALRAPDRYSLFIEDYVG